MSRPRLLDLFCGAGGAGMGYHRAGFEVVGVDIERQPRYPFEFHQADAMDYLAKRGREFDAIHASPPCQHASSLRFLYPEKRKQWRSLIEPTRDLLNCLSCPWVIENVPGAALGHSILLCGSMFGLGANCEDGEFHQLRRHRFFEAGLQLLVGLDCNHIGKPIGCYGNGGDRRSSRKGLKGFTGRIAERREAMGIDWTNRYELSQAIPPAYTEYIGKQLRAAIHD
jgi:DNA (cytosine-5)-methyltransferase 1